MNTGNAILDRLSQVERDQLLAKAVRVETPQLLVLQQAEHRITSVYFPQSGWISILCHFESGRSSEVGLVGREGAVGLQTLMGGTVASFEWMVQGSGYLYKLSVADFRDVVERCPGLKNQLLKSFLALHEQVSQTAACNANHLIHQRLARWLLMVRDRSDSDDLSLTQDLLAMMLGVRRSGVTVAANVFRKLGIIDYSHGFVRILDRPKLEAAACECYEAMKRHSTM